MSIILKPEDKVDHFVVQQRYDDQRGNKIAARYAAIDTENNSSVEIWGYNSPGRTSKGFIDYLESRKVLLRYLESNPDAAHYAIRIRGLYTDVTLRGHVNPNVILVTEPTPPSLASLLDRQELDPSRRWYLASQLALAVATLHSAGLNWGLIDPDHIGVREDGSPVLLDLACARVHDDIQLWDLPFTTEGYTAPELLDGEETTTASDVFALSATLVRLLTHTDAGEFRSAARGSKFAEELPAFDHVRIASALRDALNDDPESRPSAAALSECFADSGGLLAKPRLPIPPDWLTSPMQALAFWVAYQHHIYRHHDLPEGAIVAEFTRLLDSEVGRDRIVVREPMYRHLLAPVDTDWHDNSRCDLAVRCKDSNGRPGAIEAVVEVKQASAANGSIDDDLLALHQLKMADPSIRVFLLLVAQAKLPRRWVTNLGTANPDVVSLEYVEPGAEEQEVRIRVRRVTKAANSFRSTNTASYCCLLEVL